MGRKFRKTCAFDVFQGFGPFSTSAVSKSEELLLSSSSSAGKSLRKRVPRTSGLR